jgi:hypothetical protein
VLLPAAAQAREWRFDVSLDGLAIGTHRFVLEEAGDTRRLTSDAHFRLRLLMIEAYRYDHHAEETWRGDCLAALDSTTVEKGKTTTVRGRQEADAFVLDGPRGPERAGECAMTFAYWNPRVLQQHVLVNPQTGAPTPVTVRPIGRAHISAHGAPQDATGYRIDTDKTRIEVFYAANGEWIGLRSVTHAGHVLEYHLQ